VRPSTDREFQAIWRILRSRLETEVAARDAGPPPDHILESIRRFAEGTLDPVEKENLITALDARPDWISHLAAAIKARRPNRDIPD
jgi:hypothetical protein